MPSNEAYIKERFKKEFVIKMQHKGKLPRIVTDASERYEASYHDTVPRVFPGPGGMETVLSNMISATEKRIDKAHRPNLETDAAVNRILQATAGAAAAHEVEEQLLTREQCGKAPSHRQQLKAQLILTQQRLERERQQRLITEAKLEAVQTRRTTDAVFTRRAGDAPHKTLQERLQSEGKLPLYPGQEQPDAHRVQIVTPKAAPVASYAPAAPAAQAGALSAPTQQVQAPVVKQQPKVVISEQQVAQLAEEAKRAHRKGALMETEAAMLLQLQTERRDRKHAEEQLKQLRSAIRASCD